MRLTKKKHYQNKIEVTYKKIWDMEFLRNQHKMNREGIRVEYDRQKEAIDAVETYVDLIKYYGVEKAKELMKDAEKAYQARHDDNKKEVTLAQEDKDMLESLEKEAKAKKEDLERMEKQMQSIDKMIDGPLGEGEMTPLGTDKPLNEILDGLRAVIEMLKDEIKKL